MSNTDTDKAAEVFRLAPEMTRKIDLFLEEIYEDSVSMGKKMTGLQTSQIRGLENVVISASRFSEIVNFVKNQAGKSSAKTDKITWLDFAAEMLRQLEVLQKKAHDIGGGDPETVLEIKLNLARGWAKQVVSHYLYETKISSGGS